ncbi:MAG: hypothetical protein IPK68_13510 [Bdellovibrionales bacterium]|nr:hypothetical protein [Bdellovibrionales bacterium]
MKRREFIKYGSQIGLIGYLSRVIDNPLFAQVTHDNPIKNLIYLSLEGGWDVTLGLDPQIKKLDVSDVSLFLGYRENEILKADGLNLGPAAHGFRIC